jgi:hypothetical protein
MNHKNIKIIMGTVIVSFGLVACSGGSSSSPSADPAVSQSTTQNSTSSNGLSIPKSQQQQSTNSNYQNVIVNNGGTQNISSNGGDCTTPVSGGGTQISVISGSNISNTNMKASSSSFVECEHIDSGEKFTLNGQKVCMSQEACVGKLSQYDAVRAIESPCRDAVVLSDSEVESLLAH